MIIHSLEVKKFKILKDFKYDLSDNVNLIFGANGSGKTTVTEILNFFMQLNKKKMISYRMSVDDISNRTETIKKIGLDYYQNYCKFCDSKANINLRMKFEINGIACEYTMGMNSSNVIVDEVLKMRVNQRLTTVYNRTENYFISELERVIEPYYYFLRMSQNNVFINL